MSTDMQSEPKLCECGCGQPAPIAKKNDAASGRIKGQPMRFIRGHNPHPILDLTNQIFGRLTALKKVDRRNGGVLWICRCICGLEVEVSCASLVSGHTASCGCLARELTSARSLKDLANQIFGRLTVLRCVGRDKLCGAIWLCRCSCDGKEITVRSNYLIQGSTKSCGCLHDETAARNGKLNFKHGHASPLTPTYISWNAMCNRTTNPKNKAWTHYGGAGIKVCERWRNSFAAFLQDLGERPAGTSLSRYADMGNYSCGHCDECLANGWELNCTWHSDREQKTEAKIKREIVWWAGANIPAIISRCAVL